MKHIFLSILLVISLAAPCFAEAAVIYPYKTDRKAAIIYLDKTSDQPFIPTEMLILPEDIATISNITRPSA